MKVTTKGQVTIPKEIRRRHGFLPGTEVEFVEEEGEVRVRKARREQNRGRAIVERLSGRARTTLTTDEIMELTRDTG